MDQIHDLAREPQAVRDVYHGKGALVVRARGEPSLSSWARNEDPCM